MRPSRNEVMMNVARMVSDRSTCSRLHVGAVITRDARILSTGYNGAPAGMPHCDHTCTCDLFGDDRSEHRTDCAVWTPCRIAVHAEVNAVAYAARYGVATAGCTLYTTDAPCYACAQLVINAGIIGVVFGERYRDDSGLALLVKAGLTVIQS